MFLNPIDIHGCILFNFIDIIKIRSNYYHLDLFRVIILASLVNFIVCTICCNLDSQIKPTTEDLQASIRLEGLPRGIEDKAVVNHCGFGSYKTKHVKSSINHLPPCSKRAV